MTQVVLVDDDAGDLAILKKAFLSQQLSSSVVAHQSAEEALSWILSDPDFDASDSLLVTDLNMPRIDGFEFIRQLRQLPEPPPVIVVLSTSARPSEIERAYNYGANAYHTKPMGYRDTAHLCRGILHYWTQIAYLPSPSPTVKSLVYLSKANSPLSAAEFEDIGVRAQKTNRMADITGYLIYSDDGHFLQYLEGPADGLESVYKRIRLDERHTVSQTVSLGTGRRRFPDWSMLAIRSDEVHWPPTPTLVEDAIASLTNPGPTSSLPNAVTMLTERLSMMHQGHLTHL